MIWNELAGTCKSSEVNPKCRAFKKIDIKFFDFIIWMHLGAITFKVCKHQGCSRLMGRVGLASHSFGLFKVEHT